jgi:CheY-like chemotaxis protein
LSAAKILIVEDNNSDIYLIRRALVDLGEEFQLEIAKDGEQALQFVHDQRLHQAELRPCVILLDLHLPKYDGLDVLRAIREEPTLSHLQVVVTTSVVSPHQEAEISRLGGGYRPKPRTLSEFADLAADLIAICKGLQVPA